ncbi:MAG: hypothetical protein O3A47_09905 [Chloroflexi bacterium]|nr:hypothetical protein [Chloroflexota bacterium]
MPYEIGDRVVVKLPTDWKVRDLKGKVEGLGTMVEKPGGVVYNVQLDEPTEGTDGQTYNTVTYLSEDALSPANE